MNINLSTKKSKMSIFTEFQNFPFRLHLAGSAGRLKNLHLIKSNYALTKKRFQLQNNVLTLLAQYEIKNLYVQFNVRCMVFNCGASTFSTFEVLSIVRVLSAWAYRALSFRAPHIRAVIVKYANIFY